MKQVLNNFLCLTKNKICFFFHNLNFCWHTLVFVCKIGMQRNEFYMSGVIAQMLESGEQFVSIQVDQHNLKYFLILLFYNNFLQQFTTVASLISIFFKILFQGVWGRLHS